MSAPRITAKGSGKTSQIDAKDFKLNAPSVVELPHNPADVARVDRVGKQLYIQLNDGAVYRIDGFFVDGAPTQAARNDLIFT
ncbi:MAG: BapA prefix-like domain-containing protein, partial [Betaproteobacteria bacterium]|nr:BapA prefix-like domain-containing protein [Betaproteobacteria bacterium]